MEGIQVRLSIWRQFSSNNSTTFTVVGTFASAVEARGAASELRGVIDIIQGWWDKLDAKEREIWLSRGETEHLTPIEEKLRDQYDVPWPFLVNWFFHVWDDMPVQLFDHHVIIQNPHDMLWTGPQPFDDLLRKMGAQVALDVGDSRTYEETSLFMDISCRLPKDEKLAEELVSAFTGDFDAYRKDFWKADEEYKPKLDLPFAYEVFLDEWQVSEPHSRLFEVERDDDLLKLYGVKVYGFSSIPDDVQTLLRFFMGRGCTDVQFSFYSRREKQDVDEEEG